MKKYFLLALLFFALNVQADILISGGNITDSSWSPSGGVYVVSGNANILQGSTLNVEPGTIIKFTSGGSLSVYGSLVAHGTDADKIHFTSWADDSLGGDTNGDGPTDGSIQKWSGLYFAPESIGDMENTVVQYGNLRGIWQQGGTLSISNSMIGNNAFLGLSVENGTTTISHSRISDNGQYGLNVVGQTKLTLDTDTFSGNARTAFIEAGVDFIHVGNTSSDLSNRGFEISGTPKDGVHWNSVDLPLIIYNGSIYVPSSSTLNVEPGTVVKLGNVSNSGSIVVDGSLIAEGTSQSKIYFTSLKDDSVDGDTNGDGSATMPASANWQALVFNSGSGVDFKNVVVKYGGASTELPGLGETIYNSGNFTAENSFFGNNLSSGIYTDSGTTTISKSEFTAQPFGVRYRGGNLSLENNNIHGNTVYGVYMESLSTVDARNNWWGSDTGPHDIGTSTPSGTGDQLSGNILYTPWLTRDPTKAVNPVIIVPGILGSAEQDGVWRIDPIFHVYDNLVDTLLVNGYILDQTLFTFPYDWRKSNVDTAVLLKTKIDSVKVICGCSKVDIVAHSMGGLVTRYYAQSAQYGQDIDNLIFLGTPHRGSPKDYLTWEAGELPLKPVDQLMKFVFKQQAKENGYSNLFEYVHNFPITSVQQLLPISNYLRLASTGVLENYPTGYPSNTFLEQLNNGLPALLGSGINIKNIVGDTGTSTISKIRISDENKTPLWADGYPENFDSLFGDHGLEDGKGDGTVPIESASLGSSYDVVANSDHSSLPTFEESYVYNLLTGSTTSTAINRSIVSRILIAGVMSPADIMITAPDGRRVGKDFATGQIINEIEGAFYSGFNTDEEFITIPDPLSGEYKIEAQGTGAGGNYTLVVNKVSDDASAESTFTGNIQTNATSTLDFVVSDSSLSNISVHLASSDVQIIPVPTAVSGHRNVLVKENATSTTKKVKKIITKQTAEPRVEVVPIISTMPKNLQNTAVVYKSVDSKGDSMGKFLKFDRIKQAIANIKNWFKNL